MKLIGIARVSTTEQQGDNGEGLERQRHVIRQIAARTGADLLQIVEIIDVSGSDVAKSLEWQKKVLPAIASPDTHIAVDAVDRLIRASDFGAFAVLASVQATGTRIYTYDGVQDYARPDDMLMGGLLALLGGREKSEINRRMTAGKEAVRRAGGWAGSYRPMGWAYDKKIRKWSQTADMPLVVQAFQLAAEGVPIATIAKGLGRADAASILRNTIYRGVLTWDEKVADKVPSLPNGRQNRNKKRVARPEADVISVRFLQPEDQPVSDVLWHRAQTAMDAITKRRITRQTSGQVVCWATGYIVDGLTMFEGNTLNPKPLRVYGYDDKSDWKYRTKGGGWSVMADRLNYAMDRYLARVTDSTSFAKRVEVAAIAASASKAADVDVDRAAITAQIDQLNKQQAKANQKFDVDAFTIDQLRAETARIKAAVAALEALLDKPKPLPLADPVSAALAASKMAAWPFSGDGEAKRAWLKKYRCELFVSNHPDLGMRIGGARLVIPSAPVPFVYWTTAKDLASVPVADLLDGFRPSWKAAFCTTGEVATQLGVSRSQLVKLILRHDLPAPEPKHVKGGHGREWTPADVEAARAALAARQVARK